MKGLSFSINQYDKEGYLFDQSVLIHFNDIILRFKNIEELEHFILEMNICVKQIKEEIKNENY